MGEITRIYDEKKYIFPWGTGHATFVQLMDGAKAAYCLLEDRWYWCFFSIEDAALNDPIEMIEMTENEQEELEFQDIIADLSDANKRGMYPEVTAEVKAILVGRNARRETVFVLNSIDENLIKQNRGIVYWISRRAIDIYDETMQMREAVSQAMQEYLKR